VIKRMGNVFSLFPYLLLSLLALGSLPGVYGDIRVLGEHPGLRPTAGGAIAFDASGVPRAAVIGTDTYAEAYGIQSWRLSVGNVAGIAAVDLDREGRETGTVVAGSDIVAVDSMGRERWRNDEIVGYSIASGDLDGDGYRDEVVVGGWTQVAAIDASGGGEVLWEVSLPAGAVGPKGMGIFGNRIVVGADRVLLGLDFDGNVLWRGGVQGTILALAPIDLSGSGAQDGFVVAHYEGEEQRIRIDAYSLEGEDQGWNFEKHHDGTPVEIHNLDADGDGIRDEVVFNLNGGVYWLDREGLPAGSLRISNPSALAPIDLDGDEVSDELLIGIEGSLGGAIYAVDEGGKILGEWNRSGAGKIVALDLDGDGWVREALTASSLFGSVYLLEASFEGALPPPQSPPSPPPAEGATVEAGPDRILEIGESVTLTASASPSPGAQIVSYLWTEGETVVGERPELTVRLEEEGIRRFAVTVVDSRGETATDVVRIAAAPPGEVTLPYVYVGAEVRAEEGEEVRLDAVALPTLNESIVSYLWTEDREVLGRGESLERAFQEGTHEITVTVVDSSGESASASVRVLVGIPTGGRLPSFDLRGRDLWKKLVGNARWFLALGILLIALLLVRERVQEYLSDRHRDWLE
jgi:hypothetical protein